MPECPQRSCRILSILSVAVVEAKVWRREAICTFKHKTDKISVIGGRNVTRVSSKESLLLVNLVYGRGQTTTKWNLTISLLPNCGVAGAQSRGDPMRIIKAVSPSLWLFPFNQKNKKIYFINLIVGLSFMPLSGLCILMFVMSTYKNSGSRRCLAGLVECN